VRIPLFYRERACQLEFFSFLQVELRYFPFPRDQKGVLAQLVERLNGIEEVRGSNPLGSSSESVRSCRDEAWRSRAYKVLQGKLRLGRPDMSYYYVYILRSLARAETYYVGFTEDLKSRLTDHNANKVVHTKKFSPWEIKTTIAFRDKTKAQAFEKYLKSPSGRAFAKKRL
jgi:putative endonuclease